MMVSVITPTFNSSKYIRQCIDSVLAQSYNDFELIIIDDKSVDDTIEIIEQYTDSRIILLSLDKNSGAGIARNKGIEVAKGEYIAFLDSDDTWHPEKLEKHIAFMDENDVLFSYTSYGFLNEKGEILPEYIEALPSVNYNTMLENNYIGCLTSVYNQEKLGKVFMPQFRKRQDWALWLKILKLTDRAVSLPQVLSYYREGNESLSKNKIKLLKSNFQFYTGYLGYSFVKSFYSMIIFILNYFYHKIRYTKTIK